MGTFILPMGIPYMANSTHEAEALAAIEACSLAIEHGYRYVQFESDCLEVVRVISGNISHVIKGRSFPDSNFLEARSGCRASWAWLSLLKARDVIMTGAHWQISNGARARFWIDRWVSSLPDLHPHCVPSSNEVWNMTGFEVIDHDIGAWNFESIEGLISDSEK
ncbi:hypothetical protein L3X38_042821 [Prunus dulcis]|uniref:RNase H type-1 domain-containing protein n=1 Tax=Prunus dulcis TaxID=3755 RepID=A0AAD4YLN2_PRUDU|nr:hypothetical protein L3X38_042821 [Prunus dulcis]